MEKYQYNMNLSFRSRDEKQTSMSDKEILIIQFERFIDSIYEQRSPERRWDYFKQLSFGDIFTAIKDRLHNTCLTQRRNILNSLQLLWDQRFHIFQIAPSEIEENISQEQSTKIKVKEALVEIIYNYHSSVVASNKKICGFYRIQHNDKKLQNGIVLKEEVLNHTALKLLIPTFDSLELHNFKVLLEELLLVSHIARKDHIRKLIRVYEDFQGTSETFSRKNEMIELSKGFKDKSLEKIASIGLSRYESNPQPSSVSQNNQPKVTNFPLSSIFQESDSILSSCGFSSSHSPISSSISTFADSYNNQTIKMLEQFEIKNKQRENCFVGEKYLNSWALKIKSEVSKQL